MHPLIADVLQHQSYRKSCYDIVRGTHFDGEDLYQEMLLALLEKEDAKLWEVWHSGGHRWYVLSLIYRLFLGKGSLWDQKYRDRLLRVDVDWTRESRFDNYAKNQRGSSAYGLFQILKSKEKDPIKQIDLGLKYLEARYDGCISNDITASG